MVDRGAVSWRVVVGEVVAWWHGDVVASWELVEHAVRSLSVMGDWHTVDHVGCRVVHIVVSLVVYDWLSMVNDVLLSMMDWSGMVHWQ